MTVLADHGAPLGVSTWRVFNSAATERADIPANSERIGAMARARSRAPPVAFRLISGNRGLAELDTPRFGCRKASLGALADHLAFVLGDGSEHMNC